MPLDLPAILGSVARGLDALPGALQVGSNLYAATSRRCDRCMSRGLVIDGATGELVECTCAARRRAAKDYLLTDGWRVGLDVLRPGLGQQVGDAYDRARSSIAESRAIVGGPTERGLSRPPWHRLQRELRRTTWASIPIFGRRGGGKTQTALRLAEVAAIETGYEVEGVNLWGHDLPSWVEPVPVELLVERMELVQAALKMGRLMREPRAIDGRSKAGRAVRRLAAALEDMSGRIILIDEASLMDLGPRTPERQAVQFAMTQARHLNWICLYVGQLMSQVVRSILTSDLVIVKEPAGDEWAYDRDDKASAHLWLKAAAGFEGIRRDPVWWREPYDCPEAWCYVRSRYPVDYDGMMPIRLPESA